MSDPVICETLTPAKTSKQFEPSHAYYPSGRLLSRNNFDYTHSCQGCTQHTKPPQDSLIYGVIQFHSYEGRSRSCESHARNLRTLCTCFRCTYQGYPKMMGFFNRRSASHAAVPVIVATVFECSMSVRLNVIHQRRLNWAYQCLLVWSC